MVRIQELEDTLSVEKARTQMRRTLQDKGSTRTGNIPINPSETMENS